MRKSNVTPLDPKCKESPSIDRQTVLTDDTPAQIFRILDDLQNVDSLVAVVGDLLFATDENEERDHLLNQINLIRKMVWSSRDTLGELIGIPSRN